MLFNFRIKDVMPLVEHIRSSPKHKAPYGGDATPGFWLVKDRGVYLMSNGDPHLAKEEGSKGSKVVFAEGYDPNTDDDYYLGGDDFAELIELEGLKDIEKYKTLKVKLTATRMTVTLVG